MDLVLTTADRFVFTPYVYPSSWPPGDAFRQTLSLVIIVNITISVIYLSSATFSYFLVFDKRVLKHPQVLENQISMEITSSLKAIPVLALPTALLFLLEVRGYSKLYNIDLTKGLWSILLDVGWNTVCFVFFADTLVYWFHRALHHRWLYKHIHKEHHKWKVTSPFASHAFHPMDGFILSVPYHLYKFLFPLNKAVYATLFMFSNVWAVFSHDDSGYSVPVGLRPFINGSAHLSAHHLYFDFNYGQFFTLWDRIGGTFRQPDFNGKEMAKRIDGPSLACGKVVVKQKNRGC